MRYPTWMGLSLSLLGCRADRPAQNASWQDPSTHAVRMVPVAPGVVLETLDWGGTGRPLVLLSGLGDAAHVFDDFAPSLTDSFHVIGVTRRGFGRSSQPPTSDVATLISDLRAVLDSLGLPRVILVGHSIAGDELTAFAGTYQDRCEALVYLEAAYDRRTLGQLLQANPPPSPAPMTAADSSSPDALSSYWARTNGVRFPDAEVRSIAVFASTGHYLRDVTPDSIAFGIVGHLLRPAYDRITCPSLAIYAVPDSVQALMPGYPTLDSSGRAQAGRLFAALASFGRTSREQYRREARRGHVLEIHNANHYIFLSHRQQTLMALRAFLLSAGGR